MTDSSQRPNSGEQILLSQLPRLVWSQVLRCLNADFAVLETLAEASTVLRSIIAEIGKVSLGIAILPSVCREWIDVDENRTKEDSQGEPLLLLTTLVKLKPKINTLEIWLDLNFRPDDETLNSFLSSQSDHLQVLHISCVGLESDTVALQLPVMAKVGDLKVIRSGKGIWGEPPHVSLWFYVSLDTGFPAVERLTLSFGEETWWELFEKTCTTQWRVKHLRFIDVSTKGAKYYYVIANATLSKFVSAFPNLVSLEIRAMDYDLTPNQPLVKNLKRLTLTLPYDKHRHSFDEFITGYCEDTCAIMFDDPNPDPAQVREQLEDEHERIRGSTRYSYLLSDFQSRRNHYRKANLTDFHSLEVLRLKCEEPRYAPTMVSCPDFLNMKSLKLLDFCGVKPMHIPDSMIQKLRDRITVLFE